MPVEAAKPAYPIFQSWNHGFSEWEDTTMEDYMITLDSDRRILWGDPTPTPDYSAFNAGLEAAAVLMEKKAAKWHKEAQRHLPHWSSATNGHARTDLDRRDVCLKHADAIRELKK